jgi:hypothetical protein
MDCLDTLDRGPVLLGFFRSMEMWQHGLPGLRPGFIGFLQFRQRGLPRRTPDLIRILMGRLKVNIVSCGRPRSRLLVLFLRRRRPFHRLAEVLFKRFAALFQQRHLIATGAL